MVLSHAHIDHSGYLPALVRTGFGGPVVATQRTTELCGIVLPDSEYTGCRGTVMEDPNASEQGSLPFGYYVAIDGEVGAPIPFLVDDLERLQSARVRRAAAETKRTLTGA